MLEETAVDKDTYDMRSKAKGVIVRALAGKSGYDEFE